MEAASLSESLSHLPVQLFGASGHAKKPKGSTLASFTACYPENDLENRHIKSIVNMDFVSHAGGTPHHFGHYVSLHQTYLGRAC